MTKRYLRMSGLGADDAARLHELIAEHGIGHLLRVLADVASHVAESKNPTPLFAHGMRLIADELAAVMLSVGAKGNALKPDYAAALVEEVDP